MKYTNGASLAGVTGGTYLVGGLAAAAFMLVAGSVVVLFVAARRRRSDRVAISRRL